MKTLAITVLYLFSICSSALAQETKISFWNQQRTGANLFDRVEKIERFRAVKELGIQLIRLAPNKWLNGRPDPQEGDFLLGPPGSFQTINTQDLLYLKRVLDDANRSGLKVVITMLSLPGGRWKQHNHGVEDRQIWQETLQQDKAIYFWKQLATALKNHPAVVGYNIRNEPSPEFVVPQFKDWATDDYASWYQKVKGTPADLNLFYRKVVKAIRDVDSDTPIVLDSGFYSAAWAFKVLEPVPDDKVLYSFHMYEPYSFNSQFNKGRYHYPGPAPLGESVRPPVVLWNKRQLEKYFAPVTEWQQKYKIASNRIFVGEVGVYRGNEGAEAYLRDTIQVFNERHWHWAFYSFREDTWAGMDYELGSGKPSWKYWQAIENGKMPGRDVYSPNPLSDFLKKALRGVAYKLAGSSN